MKRHTSFIAASLALALLFSTDSRAADNTWNGSVNSVWDLSSENWGLPTVWSDNDNAFFCIPGADPSALSASVTLGSPITAHNITFVGSDYTISGGGNALTLAGATPTIAAATTSNTLAVSISGSDGVTFQGGNTVMLGDSTLTPPGNTYRGGTYVRSGKLVLRVGVLGGSALSAASHAVDSIEAIDVGATVQEGTVNDGLDTATSNQRVPNGQIPISGAGSGLADPHRLNLTGGTYDVYGNDNNQQQPQPSGWGKIVNGNPFARGILKYVGYGQTTEFAGEIMDGGTVVSRAFAGPAYQMNVDSQAGPSSSVLILSGSNSFSGFIRIGNNATIRLKGAGTLGYPARIFTPSRQVLMNNGKIDLNGTSQKTGVFWTKGDGDGCVLTNTAIGTLSILTLSYNATNLTIPGNAGSQGGISCSIQDDPATSGLIGIIKEGTATQVIGANHGVNSVKGTSVNNYHGDTVVNNGILLVMNATAISPNSAYRLNTTSGILELGYEGSADVRQLWINGVPQPNGIYDAGSTPAIAGSGSLQVTGSDFNRWSSAAANVLWELSSANWVSPTIWEDGYSAFFDALGADPSGLGTTVTLGSAVIAHEIAIAGTNYILNGGGNSVTLAGATPTITSSSSSNVIAASLHGTSGLTFTGQGTTVLATDGVDGNHYTGGTFVRGGTLVLANGKANANGLSYAVDSIQALDAGATVVMGSRLNGEKWSGAARDQIAASASGSKLNMTGGTLDLYNDPKTQRIPVPDGTGLIVNSGSAVQAGVLMVSDGQDHTFYGVIADGNNGVLVGDNLATGLTPQGPGYQIGIVQFASAKNGGGGTLTLAGRNTYSGSTRIDQGATIKLAGEGTIGFPTARLSLTGPLRVYGPGGFDLNSRNQTIALMTGGNASGKIYNSAAGTVSTLTFGYGNEQANRNANMQFIDNLGAGGILALKKVATGPAYVNPSTGLPATNCSQTLSGVNTYSGDTTVAGGLLIMATVSAVSPNSAFRLSTVASQPSPDSSVSLVLNYADTANVRQLWIDGVQQPNGVYGAGTPGIHPDSAGTLTVTGADPTIEFSRSGNTLTLSWTGGGFKLQHKAGSFTGPWCDYPGGASSPVVITIGAGAQFFRLSE